MKGQTGKMFKSISAKELRLLPVYVYGSESLAHQTEVNRGKGMMLHSQFSFCRSGEGVFVDTNNVTHTVKYGDVMYFIASEPVDD